MKNEILNVPFESLCAATSQSDIEQALQQQFWYEFWSMIRNHTIGTYADSVYVRGSCIAELWESISNPSMSHHRKMVTEVLTKFAHTARSITSTNEGRVQPFFKKMYEVVNPVPNTDVYFQVSSRRNFKILYEKINQLFNELELKMPHLAISQQIIRTGFPPKANIVMFTIPTGSRELHVFIKHDLGIPDAINTRPAFERSMIAPVVDIAQSSAGATQIPVGLDLAKSLQIEQSNPNCHEVTKTTSHGAVNIELELVKSAQSLRVIVLHHENTTVGRIEGLYDPILIQKLQQMRKYALWMYVGKIVNQFVVAFCQDPEYFMQICASLGELTFPNIKIPSNTTPGSISDKVLYLYNAANSKDIRTAMQIRLNDSPPLLEYQDDIVWFEDFLKLWRNVFNRETTAEAKEYFGDPDLLIYLFLLLSPIYWYSQENGSSL